MAPFGHWAGLPPELILLISNGFGLTLESYCRVRGVCTAWRSALAPPIPALITAPVTDISDLRHAMLRPTEPPPVVSAMLLPTESSFHLGTLPQGGQCVGSSNGWMAVTVPTYWPRIFLFNPLAAGVKEVPLPSLRNEGEPVSKIAFVQNTTPEDYTAVAICGVSRLAYADARADTNWKIIDVALGTGDRLVHLAFDADGGKVYCATVYGDVRVLNTRRRLRRRPVVQTLEIQRTGLPLDPASVYAPPYDMAFKFTRFKKVFFVGGSVYQLWRNTTSAVSWAMPGGGRFRMASDEVFVLKYDPERRPCWHAASDLGGCSVFVGKNNPVVLRPDDAAGVKANCVYWIDEWSRNEPMVFDLATRTSMVHPSAAKASSLNPSCRPVCWYFLNDKIIDRK